MGIVNLVPLVFVVVLIHSRREREKVESRKIIRGGAKKLKDDFIVVYYFICSS